MIHDDTGINNRNNTAHTKEGLKRNDMHLAPQLAQ
jgi:hypothetical protein